LDKEGSASNATSIPKGVAPLITALIEGLVNTGALFATLNEKPSEKSPAVLL
jgi:hypothetical protein